MINLALGYKIHYYLKSFWFDDRQYSIVGNSRFEELVTGNKKISIQWMKNRENAYLGSSRHLFKSILDNQVQQEGFQLYANKGNGNVTRSDNFQSELNRNVIAYKTEAIIPNPTVRGEYIIPLRQRIEVHCLNKVTNQGYYKDVLNSVSWIEVNKGLVKVDREGNLSNSGDVVISGDMAMSRIAGMLPSNYSRSGVSKMQTKAELDAFNKQEKIYVL